MKVHKAAGYGLQHGTTFTACGRAYTGAKAAERTTIVVNDVTCGTCRRAVKVV